MPLYALTIFSGAFLLFLIQPLIARQILPWFGGSAAVWSTCLAFFQVALLAGYAYSDWSTRRLAPRAQAVLHVVLLAASLATLPVLAQPDWKPAGAEDPGLRILGLLCATIGLPYFLLATTGPLMQAWFARSFPAGTVYRLFALSNLASLVALASYPFAIEPWVSTASQAWAWSAAYVAFALLCMGTALYSVRVAARVAPIQQPPENILDGPQPAWKDYGLWLTLPALGTWLLLAITSHITQNVAPIPFLWLAPLTLYLASFIICFEHERWYRRSIFVGPLLAALGACAWGLQSKGVALNMRIAIPLYLAGLFLACMFCHGELARMKPAPRHLTRYYLMISLGGALGGLFVGVAAPRIFDSYHELGLGLAATALLAAVVLRRVRVALPVVIPRAVSFVVPVTAVLVAAVCAYCFFRQVDQQRGGARELARNFYGTLQVKEDISLAADPNHRRRLIHGVILHGEQYLAPVRRAEPASYYGPDSGAGVALRTAPANKRVGVIGLGAGTLAAYGKPGDTFRFYELNPQVVDIAQREFSFLKDSEDRGAKIEIVLGDGRLSLEREAPQQFDVLVVDAFASDSIPVHLVTREALEIYRRHTKPDGIIVFHVTNGFLRLAPVVKQLALQRGLGAALVADAPKGGGLLSSEYVLVAESRVLLERKEVALFQEAIHEIRGLRPWTDDYSSLFRILK